jgi:hypothetical protein
MENGKWKMENGKWKMENGKWKMENGKWKMENVCVMLGGRGPKDVNSKKQEIERRGTKGSVISNILIQYTHSL